MQTITREQNFRVPDIIDARQQVFRIKIKIREPAHPGGIINVQRRIQQSTILIEHRKSMASLVNPPGYPRRSNVEASQTLSDSRLLRREETAKTITRPKKKDSGFFIARCRSWKYARIAFPCDTLESIQRRLEDIVAADRRHDQVEAVREAPTEEAHNVGLEYTDGTDDVDMPKPFSMRRRNSE